MGDILLASRMSSERASPLSLRSQPKRAKGKEEMTFTLGNVGMLPTVMSLAMMLSSSFAPILHCLEEVQYWCETLSAKL